MYHAVVWWLTGLCRACKSQADWPVLQLAAASGHWLTLPGVGQPPLAWLDAWGGTQRVAARAVGGWRVGH